MATLNFVSDLGGDVHSREDELFAPFYPDPSQRVLAVAFFDSISVVRTEILLRLARERKGEHLQWREWRTHVTCIEWNGHTGRLWVSGPRLYCVELARSAGMSMEVYDFGARASAERTGSVEGGVGRRFTPSITQTLPLEICGIILSYGCHDSLSFILVKTPHS